MKKLIAVAVVFALVAGGLFAADLGIDVHGRVQLINGETKAAAQSPVVTGGPSDDGIGADGWYISYKDDPSFQDKPGHWIAFSRLRLSGGADMENFGGWYRLETGYGKWGDNDDPLTVYGYAYWKPIDQFKLIVGNNPDGSWGKDGNARWMFSQMAGDSGVAIEGWKMDPSFFGGFGAEAVMLEIRPIDMLAINVGLPYSVSNYGAVEDVFNNMVLQADMNFDFGNIAITYQNADMRPSKFGSASGGPVVLGDQTNTLAPNRIRPLAVPAAKKSQYVHAYFGLSSIENLALDVGVGMGMPFNYSSTITLAGVSTSKTDASYSSPIAVGVAAKYLVNDAFGLKARVQAQFGGKATYDFKYTSLTGANSYTQSASWDSPFNLVFDIQPWYTVSDDITIFFNAGVNFTAAEDKVVFDVKGYRDGKYAGDTKNPNGYLTETGDPVVGFHVNPYVRIGAEWGPTFYVGFQLSSDGSKLTSYTKDPSTVQVAKSDGTLIDEDFDGNTITDSGSGKWLKSNDGATIIKWAVPIGMMVSF